MRVPRLLFILLVVILPISPVFSQNKLPAGAAPEICDNQIDDDGDGYIDCYDADCPCDTLPPCSVSSVPSKFKTQIAWQSLNNGPSSSATPVVANMNPQEDDLPEIIVAKAETLIPTQIGISNEILFFRGDGSNADNPMVLTIQGASFHNRPVPGPTIGDIDGDGKPELLITCLDRRIRVYSNYTENPAAPMSLWTTSSDLVDFQDQRPLLADFNGDGIPEVYVGSDIFRFNLSNPANPTLTRVLDGPFVWGTNYAGRLFYGQFTHGSCNPVAADLLSVADCNGDPDCAGLELAAGPVIYSLDLDPTDGDGYEIKIQRKLPETGQIFYFDGYTAVADMDLDGVLDILVSSRRSGETGVYVWNKNGFIQFFPYPMQSIKGGGALSCVANVFDDRTEGFARDFPEILIGNGFDFIAFNLQAAQKYPTAPYWWSIPTSASIGQNPAVTFDFNGDGISEILFNEDDIRIMYGGAAPFPPGVDAKRTWNVISAANTVSDNHPVVADVDNDGEAEIVFALWLGYQNGNGADVGHLRVMESAEGPWVPCRKLWNQYNYFVVNVNDDLTIPAQQQLHHLEMPPGSGKYPLNQTLFQVSAGGGRILLPDATAQTEAIFCQNSLVYARLNICNTGSKDLQAGTPIAFYLSDPTSTNAALIGLPYLIGSILEKDSCIVVNIPLMLSTGTVYGVVNDNGSLPRPFNLAANFPSTQVLECDYLNNIFQVELSTQTPPLNLGPDIAGCQDTTLMLNAGPGHLNYQWQDGSTGSTLLAQGAGLYWVQVEGPCVGFRRDSVLVEVFGQPQIQIDTVNGDCAGNQASATVLANSQYLPLAYSWSNQATGPTISGVATGLYTVTVTNAKGCTSVESSWVEAGGLLQTGFSTTDIDCQGQTGGIDISITAGTPPFKFAWSNSATGSSLQNLSAGTYTVTVSDGDDCSQVLQIMLSEPTALASNGFSVAGACPGDANGSATFLGAAQGTLPYSIEWSTSSTAPDLSAVPAGNYGLTITDAKGCTLEDSATVPELAPPVLDTLVTSVSCFGANDGSISMQLSGGSPGFDFQWSNFMTSAAIQNLAPGNYFLALGYSDGKCFQFFNFDVSEPLELLSAGIGSTPACPGESNGAAALNAISQGTPPYNYLWSDGSSGPTLAGLAAGSYSVVVTDANACSLTDSVQVLEFAAPVLESVVSPASCSGTADGSISLSLSGGTPAFGFLWSGGQTSPHLEQLSAGSYSLDLTYADGQCAQHVDFQITEPQPMLSAGFTTSSACPGTANGSASFLGASQGTPPYSLLWSTNENTATLSNIPGGTYSLYISDANGCSLTESVQVPEFAAPVLDATLQQISCFGNTNGSISTNLTGGTPGFFYTWSNSATTPAIQNLGPDIYELILNFANGACSQNYTFQIVEPLPLLSNGIEAQAACMGEANGSATFLGAVQGTPPYSYLWSDGSNGMTLTGLAAGIYSVVVTDAKGCSLTELVDIADFAAPILDTVVEQITCNGAGDGSISASLLGGGAVSGYLWSTGTTGTGISNLGVGAYDLSLLYGNGQCTLNYTFQINEPPALQANDAQLSPALCFGDSTGSIAVTPAGGVGPYQFLWSNAQTTPMLENLPAGNYPLTLSDANGCTATAIFAVSQPDPLVILPDIQADTCDGGTGAISVTISGGTLPYSLNWSTGAGTAQISGLSAGAYSLNLVDTLGCAKTLDVLVPAWDLPPLLTPFSGVLTCAQAMVMIGVTTDQQNLNYTWTGPNGALPNLPEHSVAVAGNYSVTATNAYGCSATVGIVVSADLQVPLAEAGQAQINVPCDENLALLDASGSSIGSNFTPRWYRLENGALVFDTAAVLVAVDLPGVYIFSNTDTNNGCVASDTVLVHFSPAVLATAAVDSISCFGEKDAAIRLQVLNGGTAPLQYSIDGQTFSNNFIFENLAPGIYPVVVRDALGCEWQMLFTLDEPPQVSVSLTASATLIDLGQTVLLEASILPPGLLLGDIHWEPAGQGLVPGVLAQKILPEATTEYLVQITDSRGCTASDRVLVEVVGYQIYAPNVIKPGSKDNDRFTLYTGSGIRQIRLLRLYDRWGELVFEKIDFPPNDASEGWDGSFRSKPVSLGVYVWYTELEGVDGRLIRRSGDVTVLR